MPGAVIGVYCILGQNIFVANKVVLGNGVKVQNNVSIYEGVICEDDVFLGPSMVFTNVVNPRAHVERKNDFKKTLVKKGATIGANATILCGIEIGEFAMIGAGAIVLSDVAAHSIVVGNPSRIVGWACECGETLSKNDLNCKHCGKRYEFLEDELIRK